MDLFLQIGNRNKIKIKKELLPPKIFLRSIYLIFNLTYEDKRTPMFFKRDYTEPIAVDGCCDHVLGRKS